MAYTIAACQPRTRLVFDNDGNFRKEIRDANIEHFCSLIAGAAKQGAKLIVFPQLGLSGYKPVEIGAWLDASIRLPGPEIERIGQAAKAAGAYVVVTATEVHDAFPGRYFSSTAIVGPDGELALTYRKNYVLSTRTRPIDVSAEFERVFGPGAYFPVLDTPLGRIGVAIAGEVYWPEVVRSLALKGAEVIVNPTSAPPRYYYQVRPVGALTRPVRAFENQVYLAFSNCGVVLDENGGDNGAPDGAWAPSEIFDFNGRSIGIAEKGADRFAIARIDLNALRSARIQPSLNFLAQLQPSVHHDPEVNDLLWPTDAFAEAPIYAQSQLDSIERQVWSRLLTSGRARDPEV